MYVLYTFNYSWFDFLYTYTSIDIINMVLEVARENLISDALLDEFQMESFFKNMNHPTS